MKENDPWSIDARTLRHRLVSALSQSAETSWNAEANDTIANLHEVLKASGDWDASAPAPELTPDGARPIHESQSIAIDIGCHTLCTTPVRVPGVPLAVAARVLAPGKLMELLERELTTACEDAAWEWARILLNATAQYALIERGTEPRRSATNNRAANPVAASGSEQAVRGRSRGREARRGRPAAGALPAPPRAAPGPRRQAARSDRGNVPRSHAQRKLGGGAANRRLPRGRGRRAGTPNPGAATQRRRHADREDGHGNGGNRVAVHIALPWRSETDTAPQTTTIVPLDKGAPLIRPVELNQALAEELKRTLRAGEEQMARECLAVMTLWMPLSNEQPAAKLGPEAFDLGPQAAGTYEAARLRAMRLAKNETAQGRFLAARQQTIDLPAAADAA